MIALTKLATFLDRVVNELSALLEASGVIFVTHFTSPTVAE